MTEIATPIGHKTLRLSDLKPEKSASFSPNLYRWLRNQAHFYKDGGTADGVYKAKTGTSTAASFGAGTLLIGHPVNGYPGDTDFSGIRLMAALCQGGKAGRWCYAGIAPDVELVDGFWDRYLEVGRCAIDPEHQEHFMGDRYSVDGDARTCLWCGHKQRRILTPRTVMDESWEVV